jgi:hypothetical protein
MKLRWTGLALIALLSCNAFAIIAQDPPVATGEPSLWQIYNDLYGAGTVTSNADLDLIQSNTELWTPAAGTVNEVHVEGVWTNAYLTEVFGYYTVNPDSSPNYQYILSGVTNNYSGAPYYGDLRGTGFSTTFTTSDTFGFFDYAHTPGNPSEGYAWLSEASRNLLGEDHLLVFTTPTPGTYLLAFEDLPFADPDGHMDYNDLLMQVTITQHIVPEPASLTLLGVGVAALIARRYRKNAA